MNYGLFIHYISERVFVAAAKHGKRGRHPAPNFVPLRLYLTRIRRKW